MSVANSSAVHDYLQWRSVRSSRITIPCTSLAARLAVPKAFWANNGEGYSVLGYPMTHMENAMTAYFFNDELKLRRNLSLNLGIRYEFNTVLHDSNGALQNFDIPTLSLDKPGAQLYRSIACGLGAETRL